MSENVKQLKIAFFVSGNGSNMKAIIDSRLNIKPVIIISDRNCGAFNFAFERGIPRYWAEDGPHNDHLNLIFVNRFKPDLIVLAGYLKKISSEMVKAYKGRIINIHPSLLPKYGGHGMYGLNVHKAVLEHSERISGCTVHVVDENIDTGPILGQRFVVIDDNETPETLRDKILKEEHILYPEIIRKIIEGHFVLPLRYKY